MLADEDELDSGIKMVPLLRPFVITMCIAIAGTIFRSIIAAGCIE